VVDAVGPDPGSDRGRELEALLLLGELPGVGPATVRTLVDRAGSARVALSRTDLVREAGGPEASRAVGDPALRAHVTRCLGVARRLGMSFLLSTDPAYPRRLHHLADPPPVLFLRGDAALLDDPGVAVVGSRRSTARARGVAQRLGSAVAAAGSPVVSGLALGVDGAAHLGALEAGGPTIAVLGRGADRAYPQAHASLFARIVRHGLVVSEFLPGTPPLPHNFPRRNRILAALSSTVVVVEAGIRSGALITVEHALDLGLDVWAVPGPIDEPATAGTNGLLADGARPLVSVEAFVRRVLGRAAPDTPLGDLSDDERRVLTHLAAGARSADEVARLTGWGPARTLATLAGLELKGGVIRVPGMRFRRAG
jgi:DNA processing protein